MTTRCTVRHDVELCTIAHRTAYFSHKLLHNDINPRSICLYVNDPSDENVIPFWNSDGTPPIRQAMLRGWRFAKHMDNPGNQMISLCRLSVRLLRTCITSATRGFVGIRTFFGIRNLVAQGLFAATKTRSGIIPLGHAFHLHQLCWAL